MSWSWVINAKSSAFIYTLNAFIAVDVISAIEFDKTGDHLATGDRGGRVVLFERSDQIDVCSNAPWSLIMFFKICSFILLIHIITWKCII